MSNKELAYAKQSALATTNWDTYQRVIRTCLRVKPIRKSKTTAVGKILLFFCLSVLVSVFDCRFSLAMTRTIKTEPAIVITAFGTTTRARATYDFFEQQLREQLPSKYRNLQIFWAFTSEIVRERANKKFKEDGAEKRYLSLAQTLANLEDEGYRKIALQSLHIFPGQEYEDMERVIEAFRHLGLRIEYGGTLLHKWSEAFEALEILDGEFLKPEEGCNVLVAHGTPETFPGSNSTYLGLDRYLSGKYSNVFIGGVDGVLTREQSLARAKTYPIKRVRFIPFMYVAGDHVMNDIMGAKADKKGVPSWAMELEQSGLKVDTVHATYQDQQLFKGLGFYEPINRMLIRQLTASLENLDSY